MVKGLKERIRLLKKVYESGDGHRLVLPTTVTKDSRQTFQAIIFLLSSARLFF